MSELIIKLPNMEGIILFLISIFFAYQSYHWYKIYLLKCQREQFLNYCKGVLTGTYFGALYIFLANQPSTPLTFRPLSPLRTRRFFPVNFQDISSTNNSNDNYSNNNNNKNKNNNNNSNFNTTNS